MESFYIYKFKDPGLNIVKVSSNLIWNEAKVFTADVYVFRN